MSCFIPSEFRGENPRFILDYCYGKSTYVVPRHEAGVSFNRAKVHSGLLLTLNGIFSTTQSIIINGFRPILSCELSLFTFPLIFGGRFTGIMVSD